MEEKKMNERKELHSFEIPKNPERRTFKIHIMKESPSSDSALWKNEYHIFRIFLQSGITFFWPTLISSSGFTKSCLTCCPELRVLEAPDVSVAEEPGTERVKGCRIWLPTSLPVRLPRSWGEDLAEIQVSSIRIQISKLVWLLAVHEKFCQKKFWQKLKIISHYLSEHVNSQKELRRSNEALNTSRPYWGQEKTSMSLEEHAQYTAIEKSAGRIWK